MNGVLEEAKNADVKPPGLRSFGANVLMIEHGNEDDAARDFVHDSGNGTALFFHRLYSLLYYAAFFDIFYDSGILPARIGHILPVCLSDYDYPGHFQKTQGNHLPM